MQRRLEKCRAYLGAYCYEVNRSKLILCQDVTYCEFKKVLAENKRLREVLGNMAKENSACKFANPKNMDSCDYLIGLTKQALESEQPPNAR